MITGKHASHAGLVLAFAAAMLLAACGGGESPSEPSGSMQTRQSAADGADVLSAVATVPLADALHFQPSVGTVSGDLAKLDRSLLDYVEVRPCVATVSGCDALASITAAGGTKGMESIRLADNFYQVNWKPAAADIGKSVRIEVLVAGLIVGSTPYEIRTPAMVAIKFRIDHNPRIRARVMHVQGRSATDIAVAMRDEFGTGGADAARILVEEGFPVAAILGALKQVFSASADDAVKWLVDSGVGAVAIVPGLRTAYGSSDGDAAKALRGAGVAAADVYAALKDATPTLTVEAGEQALQRGTFGPDDVWGAIAPDFVKRSNQWIARFGPILKLHPDERYEPASIAWTLQRSYVAWQGKRTLLGGVAKPIVGGCPAPFQLVGNTCKTAVGFIKNPAQLLEVVNGFRNNVNFLSANQVPAAGCGATCAETAVRKFIEAMDFRVIPSDVQCSDNYPTCVRDAADPVRVGDITQARSYVSVIRNKTPKTPETPGGPKTPDMPQFGTIDLQFWIFSPYNGPGTLQVNHNDDEVATQALDPIATHVGDWEVVTVRMNVATGLPVDVTGSAHGSVKSFLTGPYPQGLTLSGEHPVLYSSLNGHAYFAAPGNNAEQKFDLKEALDNEGVAWVTHFSGDLSAYLLNRTADGGKSLDAYSHADLVSIYDTCVDYEQRATPGMCGTLNPLQGQTAGAPAGTIHGLNIRTCRLTSGEPMIRPLSSPDDQVTWNLEPEVSVPMGPIARAECPRSVVVKPDGTLDVGSTANDWWRFPKFGSDVISVIALSSWEALVSQLKPTIIDVVARGAQLVCLPSLLLGPTYGLCIGAIALTATIWLETDGPNDLRDKLVGAFFTEVPSSPVSPNWKACSLQRDGSC